MTTYLEEKYFDWCDTTIVYDFENEFNKLNSDELIEIRMLSRKDKNWKFSDYIRNFTNIW